jgi:DNA-binding MarR family transcriptional regulator
MNTIAIGAAGGRGMLETAPDQRTDNSRILLGLLSSVERDGGQSQRRLATDLGVALGLINAYLRRCVKKGLVKVKQAPARRYVYYLTPIGLAEKSRLTFEYLSVSFEFFRLAKAECGAVFVTAAERGFSRVALAGISDLAEIAMICALEKNLNVTAIVDDTSQLPHFLGLPVATSFAEVVGLCDAVIVTDPRRAVELTEQACAFFTADRVLKPNLSLPPPRVPNGGRQ